MLKEGFLSWNIYHAQQPCREAKELWQVMTRPNFLGCSITMPLKEDTVAHGLDVLKSSASGMGLRITQDAVVECIGVCNTVVKTKRFTTSTSSAQKITDAATDEFEYRLLNTDYLAMVDLIKGTLQERDPIMGGS